jgi:hypothetical protein
MMCFLISPAEWLESGVARVDWTDLVNHKKTAAIAAIENVRDQLVVMRERLFQLSAATAARTKKVEGLLIDCGGAARVFGPPIGLPDWNNVLATPGRKSAHSLDEELREEMQRVTNSINWNSLETSLDRTNNDHRLLIEILRTLDAWVRNQPTPKRTLRQIVLDRLEEAGAKGSKAAVIRDYAKDNLQCDFSIKAVGMPLNRLAKEGRARRASRIWLGVKQGLQTEDVAAIT